MSPTHIRWMNRSLWLAQASIVAVMAVVIVEGFISSDTPRVQASVIRPATSAPAAELADAQPLTWYAPLWTRDLRQPPFPPPTPVVAVASRPAPLTAPPPPPPPNVRLLGTAVEDHTRYGLFIDGQGQVVVRRVTEMIDGYQVTQIERGRAEIQASERSVWITMPDYQKRLGGAP